MSKSLIHSLRYGVYGLSIFIILVAAFLQVSRLLAPSINTVRPNIEQFVSRQIGADVSIGEINAHWYGLRPQVIINQLTVQDSNDTTLLSADGAKLSLDLFKSALAWQWIWHEVSFDQLFFKIKQDEHQQWSVAGFSSKQGAADSWRYNNPVDLFNITPRVDISDITLQVEFANGQSLPLVIPSVSIANDGSFHRLQATAQLDDAEVFSFSLERTEKGTDGLSSAQGFLSLNRFPLGRWFNSLDIQAVNHSAQLLNDSYASARVWFVFSDDGSIEFTGTLDDLSLPANQYAEYRTSNIDVSSTLSGQFTINDGWDFHLNHIVGNDKILLKQVSFGQKNKENIYLAIPELNLEALYQWLDSAVTPPKEVAALLDDFSISGHIENIDARFNKSDFDDFLVKGNFNNFSLSPIKKIPGVSSANGYFESSLTEGFFNINSDNFQLYPQQIFDQPIDFSKISGQVKWLAEPAANTLLISSGLLKGQGWFGQSQAYFLLDVPLDVGSRPSDFTFYAGINDVPDGKYLRLIPNRVPRQITQWLNSHLPKGEVTHGGLIYRGGFSDERYRTVELFLDVKEAQLDYGKEWPIVEQMTAHIDISNRQFVADIHKANVDDITVDNIRAQWPVDSDRRLRISGNNKIPALSGLSLLQSGWLQNKVNGVFDDWDITGDINLDATIDFSLPSEEQSTVTVDPNITVGFLNNDIVVKDQRLNIRSVNGEVAIQPEKGISSNKLSAQLFEGPVNIDISQASNDKLQQLEDQVTIKVDGIVGIRPLSDWLGSPLPSISGETAYQATLLAPLSASNGARTPPELTIESDLLGLDIQLPSPLGKAKNEKTPLAVSIQVQDKQQQYKLSYRDILLSEIALSEKDMSGYITIGDTSQNRPLPAKGTVVLDAALQQFDWQVWSDVFKRYSDVQSNVGDSDLLKRFSYHVTVDELLFNNYRFNQLSINGENENSRWYTEIDSAALKGNVIVEPDSQKPTIINLKHLVLPEVESDREFSSQSNNHSQKPIDFASIGQIQVSIDDLNYKDKRFYDVQFLLLGKNEKLIVENIYATFGGMRLSGRTLGTGARLVWDNQNGVSNTGFAGNISGGNIETLLNEWKLPSGLISEATRIDIDTFWQGSPMNFSVAGLTGGIDILLESGVFVRNKAQASTGILRLFSLFNFDTWARRLRLDFSDLYKKGIVFDRLTSYMKFDTGKIYFQRPLYVESPSSEFTMAGVIDYPNENIDAVLLTTLPVGGNLTFATALIAGLPAAVGVYIASKLFKPQVDQASSLTYSVKGNWADPKVKFIKLFGTDLGDDSQQPSEVEILPFSPGQN